MLRKYKGQWIAYNGSEGILAHHENVSEVISIAKQKEQKYILKYLHPYTYSGLPKLLPVGREVVFDAFDIEFKQKEEMILFKKRPDFIQPI